MNWQSIALVSSLLAGIFGCHGGSDGLHIDPEETGSALPEFSWEGEHVRFATDDPEPVCGGSLEYLDAYVGALKSELGAPGDWTVDYYQAAGYDTEWWPCSEMAAGCSIGKRAFSTYPGHLHETVHAVNNGVQAGSAHRILEEGRAMAYGGSLATEIPVELGEAISHWEETGSLTADGYQAAGHFYAWLLDEYGLDSIQDVEAGTTHQDEALDVLEELFEANLGESFTAAVDRYEAEAPTCVANRHALGLLDCQRAPDFALEAKYPEWPGENLFHDLQWDPVCGDTKSLGPNRDGDTYRSWVFDLPEPPDGQEDWIFFITLPEDGPQGYWHIASCEGCEGTIDEVYPFVHVPEGSVNPVSVAAPRGRYVLTAFVEVGSPELLAEIATI